MIYPRNEAITLFNRLGSQGRPFFFFTDFLGSRAFVEPTEAASGDVQWAFHGKAEKSAIPLFQFEKSPVSFDQFQLIFDRVRHEIQIGNSFLVNLTFKTPIRTDLSLETIYLHSQAKYKLLYKNKFVVFSPETFVKIEDGNISSFPMKGTINAALPLAAEQIMKDTKELAEHVTIVDLIRNDLSLVAHDVAVTKFRFLTEVQTHDQKLLQVSSEISGKLPLDYQNSLGDLFFSLLPAGSISGAPKPKTVDVIQKTETHERGFYTGVCGYFDGKNLDSGVMIRFIEQEDGRFFYKSGGGITSFSSATAEYQEMIDKIYVPIY